MLNIDTQFHNMIELCATAIALLEHLLPICVGGSTIQPKVQLAQVSPNVLWSWNISGLKIEGYLPRFSILLTWDTRHRSLGHTKNESISQITGTGSCAVKSVLCCKRISGTFSCLGHWSRGFLGFKQLSIQISSNEGPTLLSHIRGRTSRKLPVWQFRSITSQY